MDFFKQKGCPHLKPSGISDLAASLALKRISNKSLWLHALRLKYATIRKSIKLKSPL
jgi:hypothetical protein